MYKMESTPQNIKTDYRIKLNFIGEINKANMTRKVFVINSKISLK